MLQYLLRIILKLILLSSLLLPKVIAQNQEPYTVNRVVYNIGDSSEWATPSFCDKNWKPATKVTEENGLPSPETIPSGVFWIRVHLTIEEVADELSSRLLVTQMFASSETYWDGTLVNQNGTVAPYKEQEVPGLLFAWANIDESLFTTGDHVIAYRVSSNYDKPAYVGLIPEFYIVKEFEAIRWAIKEVLPQRFLLGIMAITGLFYFLLFALYDRKLPYFLFGLFCSGISAFELIRGSSLRNMFSFTYDQAPTLMLIVLTLLTICSFVLPWFLIEQFEFKRKGRWISIIGTTMLVAIIIGGDTGSSTVLTGLIGLLSCIVVTIVSTIKKRSGSRIVLVGTCILMIGFLVNSGQYSTYGFLVFILCLLTSLTKYMREQRDDHQRALVKESKLQATKARLETELLKSSIQPHFLMNTLNALIDWVEENPKKGVMLILEIGRHFDILIAISEKESISLKLEAELCQSYLNIMSYRKEVAYKLNTIGVSDFDSIPPCVIHTLAENGITHNRYDQAEVTFTLSIEKTDTIQRITFETPRAVAQKSKRENRLSQGTGLKYVEARLEECYPKQWRLHEEVEEYSWKTIIEITIEKNAIGSS